MQDPDSKEEPTLNGRTVDTGRLNDYLEQLKAEQKLIPGLVAGLLAALVGAVIWAVITVATGYQIGYMAVGVGFMVGFAIKTVGKGIDPIFGYIGGGLALLGCLLGNFFTIVGFAADGMGYFETLLMIDYAIIPEVMIETFGFMDILFYGIAIYEGYKFSFRAVSEDEIMQHATEPNVRQESNAATEADETIESI